MSNENVGPMMTKHRQKLSKAKTDAFRSNDREKTNGMKLMKRADSAEKTEPSPISNENQLDNQGEVERPSESKPVIPVRRDLLVSDKDDSSAPSQTPAVKRKVKKFEKLPLSFEEFEGALKQGKTREEVIEIAGKGLASLMNYYTKRANAVMNERAKQIQSLVEDKIIIEKMVKQRYKVKMKRMEEVHYARVKKLNDRMKQAKFRQQCFVCKRTANFRCCHKSYYCSLNCQDLDAIPSNPHKDVCQQQTMVASDPFLSLNPNHRDLFKKEEDINEDKKVIMEKISSISVTTDSTVTQVNPENNLNVPSAVPVLPNEPVTESPLPTQISTLFSLNSDPTEDEFPMPPAL